MRTNLSNISSTVTGICLLIFALSSCTGNKWLEEGQRYYDGANVEFVPNDSVPKDAQSDLRGSVQPEPNTKILISRPKVWFYHIAGEVEKEKGFRHWVKTKLGEEPILLSDVDIERNKDVLEGKARNAGFFHADVIHDTTLNEHSAELNYTVQVNRPYRIRNIHMPKSDTASTITRILNLVLDETTLKKGDIYSLNDLIEERDRIAKEMKMEGFFYFQNDYLLFQADSTIGTHNVDIYFKLKDKAPDWALQRYYLRDVFVNTNYSLNIDTTVVNYDTIMVEDIHYLTTNDFFKPKRILEAIKLDPGDLYDLEKHNITLKQLANLGVFQFINIRFNRVKNTDSLDAHVLLNPMMKKSIRAELLLTTKSNNFTGPDLNVQFQNRNTFKGAELLTIDVTTGYEVQLSSGQRPLNSYNLELLGRLYLPRYRGPIKFDTYSTEFMPRTFFELRYELLDRAQFYSLNSFSGAFGYSWKETEIKSHDLKLLNINYIHLLDRSQSFNQLLETNTLLRESFDDQLIIGTIYTYTHSNQFKENKDLTHFFQGKIELSGNTIYGGFRLFNDQSERTYEIAGVQFAQYARLDLDYRIYINVGKRGVFAMRRIIAAGYPYLNNTTLPYSKQFFVGGANSIRAFLPRSVGPGTFDVSQIQDEASSFLDQSGEMKIGGNFEYRHSFTSIIEGAVFVDGGNVWLLRDREQKPGGQFDLDTFWFEFAIGTGAGLRIDANFILLRLDVGIPLKKPWLERGDRWVVGDWQFGNQDWRRDNIIYNLAIGYPF